MKKCMYCGKEGTAPDVRGVKSIGINVGNFRITESVDIEVCEMCANVMMGTAMGNMLLQMPDGSAR